MCLTQYMYPVNILQKSIAGRYSIVLNPVHGYLLCFVYCILLRLCVSSVVPKKALETKMCENVVEGTDTAKLVVM